MGLGVVLAGLEKGGQPLAGLAFCASILNKLFPNCLSTVLGGILSEAEPRGLEGCCVRARHFKNSVVPLVVLPGQGKGGAARPLINFGYGQNLSKNSPGGEKRRVYADRAVSGRFNHWYLVGGGASQVRTGGGKSARGGTVIPTEKFTQGVGSVLYGQWFVRHKPGRFRYRNPGK